MPTDLPYYTRAVPDDQKQAVETLAGINRATLLVTTVAFPEEQVIDASYLPIRQYYRSSPMAN
jgi:hypothetical protein